MNRKTVLALALASVFSVSTSVAYAQSDDEKSEAPKPELIAQSDDEKSEAPKPELIA